MTIAVDMGRKATKTNKQKSDVPAIQASDVLLADELYFFRFGHFDYLQCYIPTDVSTSDLSDSQVSLTLFIQY